MPTYDVECSACGFSGEEMIKLADLGRWDEGQPCPACAAAKGEFRRVISAVNLRHSGPKATARSEASRKRSLKDTFTSSGAKDDMRHNNARHVKPEKVAAAVESVRKGEFEGFK